LKLDFLVAGFGPGAGSKFFPPIRLPTNAAAIAGIIESSDRTI